MSGISADIARKKIDVLVHISRWDEQELFLSMIGALLSGTWQSASSNQLPDQQFRDFLKASERHDR
jgi:hypothetical protein